MKTTLGMEVNLGPGHIVLDGDPAPPAKGTQQIPPLFGPYLLWPRSPISAYDLLVTCTAGLMHECQLRQHMDREQHLAVAIHLHLRSAFN